jgi:hypothetical protein
MHLEKADSATVNKLFRPSKLQRILDQFMHSDDICVRLVFTPEEYTSVRSAQNSYHNAIRRYQLPMVARVLNGQLYLIKTTTTTNDRKGVLNT